MTAPGTIRKVCIASRVHATCLDCGFDWHGNATPLVTAHVQRTGHEVEVVTEHPVRYSRR